MDRASFPGFLDESEFKCRPDDFARGDDFAKLSIIQLVFIYEGEIVFFYNFYSIRITKCAMMYDVCMMGLSGLRCNICIYGMRYLVL